jgi:ketosteroid isomerase-like protein
MRSLAIAWIAAGSANLAFAGQPLQSAAKAEYLFAKAAQTQGTRTAFLNWFANEGVMCAPSVVNAIETVAKWPESKDSLVWYPSLSYTASSDDMGYTIGPWTLRAVEGQKDVYGTVLSVWRKQPDNSWRVVMDCGVNHPRPAVMPKALDVQGAPGGETGDASPAASASSTTAADSTASRPSVAEWIEPVARAETQFAEAVFKSGLPAALREFAAPDVRVLYTGVQTAETLTEASALLAQKPVGKTFQHVFTNQAHDGSLGYAWGYVGNAKAAKPTAVYVNVWRKMSASASWKLVAQTYHPLPEPKK